jgi:hypothetical protein
MALVNVERRVVSVTDRVCAELLVEFVSALARAELPVVCAMEAVTVELSL